MAYRNEKEFENYIRGLIDKHITTVDPAVYALKSKKAVDILICRELPKSQLSFIEVKFHQTHHGRLGFGGAAGEGFQPEIVLRKPKFFERRLRWVLASQIHKPGKILFVDSATIRAYLAGGVVSQKFNNIQTKIFAEGRWLTESQLVTELRSWLRVRSPG